MKDDMHKTRIIATIENVFTMTIMSALIIALYVLGAGKYSLFALLLILNLNSITTRETREPKPDENDELKKNNG